MKLNKGLLVTSTITLSLLSAAANADLSTGKETGTIQFRGQFVDTTCTIETNNEGTNIGTVQLGTWLTSNFATAGETTAPTKFVIALNGCPDIIKKAKVTFSGPADSSNSSLFKTTADVGAAIGITHDDGFAYIAPDAPAGEIDISGKTGEKTYYARYVTTGETSAGAANADVTVTISYNQ